MDDLISRQATIDAIINLSNVFVNNLPPLKYAVDVQDAINEVPSAQQWIPFERRELDDEEKEWHPDWDFILCGKLPEDRQRILVNIKCGGHEAVQMDEFWNDCDGCFLESGYEICDEATAWMPLPEPWKGESDDNN